MDSEEIINLELQKEYLEKKTELEKIYVNECKGAGIRSRVRWMEKGEKNTKYFMSLEKRNAEKKNIYRLKHGKKIITEQTKVLEEVVNFYEELYTSKHVNEENIKSYFDKVHVPSLSEEEKKTCEGLLSITECKKAVFNMAKNKSPVLDGLPIEFYRVFWADIEVIIVNALNENFVRGFMSKTQRVGVISLIYKKGDVEDLRNWRPITLLNGDYKIMATVIAHRIQKVLNVIIHENQVGYMKGRLSGYNIRLTQDICQYVKNKELSCALMLVDFTKAFDMIEFDFIKRALETFNFGIDILRWIELMYNTIVSSVMVNGWISKQFSLSRGIRQGCPVSALLFVIAVEILAERIRTERKIEGITFRCELETFKIKVLQYADDTSLFLHNKKSLKMVINELYEF